MRTLLLAVVLSLFVVVPAHAQKAKPVAPKSAGYAGYGPLQSFHMPAKGVTKPKIDKMKGTWWRGRPACKAPGATKDKGSDGHSCK